ncbi:hypothetical protein P4U65_24635 [Bacillus pacificus]|nr:hypothetical protein [Bacillus thuringiensis]MED1303678.1 hypothetical protein [Bacillus pacificus]
MLSNKNRTNLGGCEMKKEQLLKEATIEWLLNIGNDDVGELLESATLGTYKEE